jgi:hypothetical protein
MVVDASCPECGENLLSVLQEEDLSPPSTKQVAASNSARPDADSDPGKWESAEAVVAATGTTIRWIWLAGCVLFAVSFGIGAVRLGLQGEPKTAVIALVFSLVSASWAWLEYQNIRTTSRVTGREKTGKHPE